MPSAGRRLRRPGRSRSPRPDGKAVAVGKRRDGRWVDLGKGGQKVGKWCSFSHLETTLTRLFPHKSTQVVDFPHLAMVSQAELGTKIRRLNWHDTENKMRLQVAGFTGWTAG